MLKFLEDVCVAVLLKLLTRTSSFGGVQLNKYELLRKCNASRVM
jgi:hypothetical protein